MDIGSAAGVRWAELGVMDAVGARRGSVEAENGRSSGSAG